MWLFLWVLFVLAFTGFLIWSYHATYEQKKAWKAYAKKMGLNYIPNRVLEPPQMEGEIKGYEVNCYPQLVENTQGQKSVQNVIEVFLNKRPDLAAVVASSGFEDFLRSVELPDQFEVGDPDWPKKAVCRSFAYENAHDWFAASRNRVNAIQQLLKLPFTSAFVTDGRQAFIVIRTANPLSEPQKLNQLVMKLISIVELLESDDSAFQARTANPKDDKKTVEPETSAPSDAI